TGTSKDSPTQKPNRWLPYRSQNGCQRSRENTSSLANLVIIALMAIALMVSVGMAPVSQAFAGALALFGINPYGDALHAIVVFDFRRHKALVGVGHPAWLVDIGHKRGGPLPGLSDVEEFNVIPPETGGGRLPNDIKEEGIDIAG